MTYIINTKEQVTEKEWVAALRSDKYKQCTKGNMMGYDESTGLCTYCAMAVLAKEIGFRDSDIQGGGYFKDLFVDTIADDVYDLTNKDFFDMFPRGFIEDIIITYNDTDEKSLTEIADLIDHLFTSKRLHLSFPKITWVNDTITNNDNTVNDIM